MSESQVPEWHYEIDLSSPLARDRQIAHYTVAALQPRAAINLAQTQLDRIHGPGRWIVEQACIAANGRRTLVVRGKGE